MPFNEAQREILKAHLQEYLGSTICGAVGDPQVTEIKVGEDGKIWLFKHGEEWTDTSSSLSKEMRMLAIGLMAKLARKDINEQTPTVETHLDGGELPNRGSTRVSASVWPSSEEPCLYIRKHSPVVFPWQHYIKQGTMSESQVERIREHIFRRSNIVWSGGTGSGKTTCINTCLWEIEAESDHVLIIEDTKEIRCTAQNLSRFYTSETVSMSQQVKHSMRRLPTRLVIGEVRDEAAKALIEAWNTGHRGGFTSVHANSAIEVFDRLAALFEMAGVVVSWRILSKAIDLICHMEMTAKGRKLVELKEVEHNTEIEQIPVRLKSIG